MGIEELRQRREEILTIAARHGAHNVRVFGSVVRGEAGPESDIDFLVEMDAGRSLLDLARLLMDLEDALCRGVDVVEPEGLHWYLRDRILREAVPI